MSAFCQQMRDFVFHLGASIISTFTVHRELEAGHEETMKSAVVTLEEHASEVGDHSHRERQNFHDGVIKVLIFLEGFLDGT